MTITLALTYDVFVNDPAPQHNGVLPNGEPKLFTPQASTLICGSESAVLATGAVTPGPATEALEMYEVQEVERSIRMRA